VAYTSLAPLNATLNAIAAVLLVAGFIYIRRGRVREHRACMLAAVAASAAFLTSYVVYHYNVGSVPFGGEGWVRALYFAILIPHVVLAASMTVLVPMTLARALRRRFAAHRRIARWTWPIWIYVSVTGVIVYLMVYHLYGPPILASG
jgi:uncharacterized membrane protein YozB (DUF420 family)